MERASQRLSILGGHINPLPDLQSELAAKAQPIDDVWASLHFDQYLSEDKIALRKKVRTFMESIEKDVLPLPFHFNYQTLVNSIHKLNSVPKMAQLGINGLMIKDFGGPGFTNVESWAMIYEIAKVDMSVCTFLMVHNCIGMSVINYLGSEEQRARLLPECIKLEKICSFGLTEPDYGSDASSLRTSAKKVEGGYILNGQKRWIGNGTFADYIIVWARNEADGNRIQAFVVTKGSKGLTTKKIENKYALRITQNADVYLDGVFVPDNMRLEKAKDFSSANQILEHSRIGVAWFGAALGAGAYEAALKYALSRKQFGKPIAQFQATQLKLSKMLAQCEMMMSLCMRVSQLVDQGKTTIGQIGRAKAICSLTCREVISQAREIMGGNGILLENRVIKHMLDAEVVHTYEGTYEVNMLVSGREITGGLSAFK
eukprot:403373032